MAWIPKIFQCRICRYPWTENTQKEENDVETAASANKQGPLCELCRHLVMALRYSQGRKIPFEVCLARVVVDEYPISFKEDSPA